MVLTGRLSARGACRWPAARWMRADLKGMATLLPTPFLKVKYQPDLTWQPPEASTSADATLR